MTRLAERLANHPARHRLRELRAALDGLSDDAKAAAERDCEGALGRAEAALSFIDGGLTLADPEPTALSTLEHVDSALSNVVNMVPQLQHDPAAVHAVDQRVDDVLAAGCLLFISTPVTGQRAGAATRAFNTALQATADAVAAQASELQAELAELEERRVQAEEAAAASYRDRNDTLTTQMDGLTARVDAEQQRLDHLVPTFEAQFGDAQAAREASFQELRDQLTEGSGDTAESLKEAAKATATKLRSEANTVLTAIREVKTEVETLYGVIADTSTTGAFRDEATAQRTAADKWRHVAVGFGVVAALIALGSVAAAVLSPNAASTAGTIVAKATAALVAAGIAAYAGRQSGRHREREEEAKRLELELVAFPPFIASLDEEQRRAVRQQFADRAFRGRPVDPGRRSLLQKDDSFGVGSQDLMQMITTAVDRAVGK